MDQKTTKRPLDIAEETLLEKILTGEFPIGSKLPGERKLVAEIGVTRPTLREALRRLEQDGWLTVQHGKATVVNNIWRDGGLNVITTLTRYPQYIPADFVDNLLQVRIDLAPSYMSLAVQNNQTMVLDYFRKAADVPRTAEALAKYDWGMHRMMTIASGNPIYTLVLNGFSGFYEQMAIKYFSLPVMLDDSRPFYAEMIRLTEAQDVEGIREYVAQAMTESAELWRQVEG